MVASAYLKGLTCVPFLFRLIKGTSREKWGPDTMYHEFFDLEQLPKIPISSEKLFKKMIDSVISFG